MSIFNNSTKVQKDTSKQIPALTAQEIELILRLLSTTTFPVKDIETLYAVLLKLQDQFKILVNDKNSV